MGAVALRLVLGGARSGKSRFAQGLLAGRERVLYVATAYASDAEMEARIARHRAERPPSWRTVEAQANAGAAIRAAGPAEVALLDCMTVLISNRLAEAPVAGPVATAAEAAAAGALIEAEVEGLLGLVDTLDLVIVANEVGLGVVPAHPVARLFRDLAGQANQRLAAAADEVWFLAAGLPLRLKPAG
jgi:adenosylcobinamide kinase/adenosylcobinamide-phosphate guanylyltransferase